VYCYVHDPSRAAERAAARKKGGLARHGRVIGETPAAPEPMPIDSLGDIKKIIQRAVNDVMGLESSLSRARTLGYLAGVAIKAIEVGELERRIAALEELMK
jgi:hypothetical protein